MAGTKGNGSDVRTSDETQYQNLLYVLPERRVVRQPELRDQHHSLPTSSTSAVHRLAVDPGDVARRRVHRWDAVSRRRAERLRRADLQRQQPVVATADRTFGGMATSDGSQTPPTALAWDPSGSGLLAIGVMSWGRQGFFVQIDGSGTVQPELARLEPAGTAATWNGPALDGVRAAPGRHPGGRVRDEQRRAVGRSEGDWRGDRRDSPHFGGPATIAINPIPRFDGSSGGSDFAVSYQTVPAPTFGGMGGLLRWDGTAGDLTASADRLRFVADGGADVGCVPAVVSGDQAGSFPGQQHVGGADHGDVAGGAGFVVGVLVCAELGGCAGVPDGGGPGGGRSDLVDLHDGCLHGWALTVLVRSQPTAPRTICGGAIW